MSMASFKCLNRLNLICILGFAIFFSCNSNRDELVATVIELSGKVNEKLKYELGNQPTEGGYIITQQPESYKISEIVVDDVSGKLIYLFIPADNFSGRETAEITLKTSIGDGNFKSFTILVMISIQ